MKRQPLPRIGFTPEIEQCPECGGRLRVRRASALRHLGYLAPRLQRDRHLLPLLESLEERWRWFCELRDVLRLSNAHLPHGQPRARSGQLPALELLRLEQIKLAVEAYQAELEKDLPAQDRHAKRPSSPQGIILNALERHGDQLFGHPARIDADGQVIAVVERTNNIPEQFFGEQKRLLRRRLGRAHLGRDLEQQPAQVALVANLRSAAYVRVVCGSLDHLPAAIAAIDSQASAKPATVLRDHRGKKLQHHVRKLLAQTELPSASRCEPRWPVPGLTTADLPPIEPKVETLANQATDIICNKHRFFYLADLATSRTNNQSQREPVPSAT